MTVSLTLNVILVLILPRLVFRVLSSGLTDLQLVVELEHGLGLVTELGEAGAQTGHLLPALVGDVHLVRVYLPEQQVHVHKGLVELFLQDLQPSEHGHGRAEAWAVSRRRAPS